jgi:hypothetical protein
MADPLSSECGPVWNPLQRNGDRPQPRPSSSESYRSILDCNDSAWERGANDNLNGLLRQFFPKHRKLEEVTDEKIALAQHRLSHRPRKCLGYETPHQVFWEQLHSNQPVALRC